MIRNINYINSDKESDKMIRKVIRQRNTYRIRDQHTKHKIIKNYEKGDKDYK